MKNKTYSFISIVLILLIWQIASHFTNPLLLPSVSQVVLKLIDILKDENSYLMILITTKRLLIGSFTGVFVGVVLGIMMGRNKVLNSLILPIMSIFQTIPPVSLLVLSLVWFGFNGKPSIFIVITSTFPIIAINISEGFKNIDEKLLEMAKIYKFSNRKVFEKITFPSLIPFFKSACLIALGSSFKIAVMGEVLTTTDGIGAMLKLSRVNIEPESTLAWSIIILALYFVSRAILNLLFGGSDAQSKKYFT